MIHTAEYLQEEIKINDQEIEVRNELDQINQELNSTNSERKQLVSNREKIDSDINNIKAKGLDISTTEFVSENDLLKEKLRLTELINAKEDELTKLYSQKKEKEAMIFDFNEAKKKLVEEATKRELESKENLISGKIVKETSINAIFEGTPELKALAGSDVSGKILQSQMKIRCPKEFTVSSSLVNNINNLSQIKCTDNNEEKRNERIAKINKEKMLAELDNIVVPNKIENQEVANIKSFVEESDKEEQNTQLTENVEIKTPEENNINLDKEIPEINKKEEFMQEGNETIGKVASSVKDKINKIVSVYNKVSPISDTKELIKDETGKIVNLYTYNGLLKKPKIIETPVAEEQNNISEIPTIVQENGQESDNNVNLFSNENIKSLGKIA